MWLHAAVLVALTLDVLVETAADLLNARAFRAPLPATLVAWYPADAHARAPVLRARPQPSRAAERAAGLIVVLAAWVLAVILGRLDAAVRSLDLGAVSAGVVYVGAVLLVQQLIGLPFAWWETFVVENRYGFNRTSGATFAADLLKQLGLVVVIGVPVFAGLMAAFVYTGDAAWLWCLGLSWLVVLATQVVAPAWLLPLFYTFRRLPDEHVGSEIRRWAAQAGASLDDVYVVDGSRRSAKGNAFLTGMGRHKRIALFDTLLESHPLDEVVAVVLHEIGHHELGHIWKGTVLTLAHIAVICWLLGQAVSSRVLFDVFGVAVPSAHVGLVLFILVYAPVSLVVSVAVNAYARRCEFEADAFARRQMGTGGPMGTALARLSAAALAHPTPHPLFVWLHGEHPPAVKRMEALIPDRSGIS